MNIYLSRLPVFLLLCLAAGSASAWSTQGTISVEMELTRACNINGAPASNGQEFGVLDFGEVSTLFATKDGSTVGEGGVRIQCSPGSDGKLKIVSSNTSAVSGYGTRAMKGPGASDLVPYNIYSDPGRTMVLNNDDYIAIPADGVERTFQIYGRAMGMPKLNAGIYSDVITVQLEL